MKYHPSINVNDLIVLRVSMLCGKMAVEKMQGISRLEQFVEELSEEERAKELKQEKKRQKRKNRRKNKCGFDSCEHEADHKEKILDEVILPGNRKSRPFTLTFCFTETCHLTYVVGYRVQLNVCRLARPVWVTRRRKRPDVTTTLL